MQRDHQQQKQQQQKNSHSQQLKQKEKEQKTKNLTIKNVSEEQLLQRQKLKQIKHNEKLTNKQTYNDRKPIEKVANNNINNLQKRNTIDFQISWYNEKTGKWGEGIVKGRVIYREKAPYSSGDLRPKRGL
ncbi:hypothetical protein M0812_18085 [Anaeramoeba flamelloides]|uniref:Uncharacterized protein n=1 Tax=Anaeramoeba flamelloides TaxID=1746091 RepID=A0AAV7Z4F4_9EUKA|nr:hypothetical protein M0812_18085 [Anaeramoeba flamelloides]